MPNIKSAAKRARQSEHRRARNRNELSAVSTYRRKFFESIEARDRGAAQKLFRAYCSILDKAARKGILPKNTADRRKQRASAKLATVPAS